MKPTPTRPKSAVSLLNSSLNSTDLLSMTSPGGVQDSSTLRQAIYQQWRDEKTERLKQQKREAKKKAEEEQKKKEEVRRMQTQNSGKLPLGLLLVYNHLVYFP